MISLGSEGSMRMVMERLSKKDLHGQNPVVTLPTKQALNNFEAQQKTRPTPPQGPTNGPPPQGMPPRMQGPPMQGGPRPMMNPNGPPGNFRPMHPGMGNMQGPPGQMQGMPPRMQVSDCLKEISNQRFLTRFAFRDLLWDIPKIWDLVCLQIKGECHQDLIIKDNGMVLVQMDRCEA